MELHTLREFYALSPFMNELGAEPTACTPGRVTAVLPVAPCHRQHSGHVHAGAQTTLADHTMGSAAQTDRKSTRLNSSHSQQSRMPSSA